MTYIRLKNRKRFSRLPVMRLSIAFSCAIILFFAGFFTSSLYSKPYIYLDIDVNPSIGITVNRFNKVIGLHAYNEESEAILASLKLYHKDYNNALRMLINTFEENGYIADDSLVSVTLQSDNQNRADNLISELQDGIENTVSEHHGKAVVEVFLVSKEIKDAAYEVDISPAKYLAILELMEVDPEATIEGCRGHSVNQLRQLIKEHSGHRHGNNGTSESEQTGNGVQQRTRGNHHSHE